MHIENNSNSHKNSLLNIYAIADSHQETRKTSALLSKILQDSKVGDNVLLLICGDIFKGIYPREFERECYLKFKEQNPDIQIVMTLGNNDFGFDSDSLDYLIETIKFFELNGIHVVCSNIFNTENKRPNWIKPYTIVDIAGTKTFVAGFCIDNLNTVKFGIISKNQFNVIQEVIDAIKNEKPDNVILLNHDYMPISKDIVKFCQLNGVTIDVVIGGHDHEFVQPDNYLNIYYPKAFSGSMYKIVLRDNDDGKKVVESEMIENTNLSIADIFSKDIVAYEKETGLLDKIVPYTLNLPKWYSKPCPLGSFLADEMMQVSESDIGFFSTGFLMKPMYYKEDEYITNYIFQKTIVADTPIKIVNLSSDALKKVFMHSLKYYGYGNSNPKFLQCSNNIRIEGSNNQELGVWELKQIYIDGEPLFDSSLNPINPTKKYRCAIDSFIAEGGQGFPLQHLPKTNVYVNNHLIKINEVLLNALIKAKDKYPKGYTYPQYVIGEM